MAEYSSVYEACPFHPEVRQVLCINVSTNQHLSLGIEVLCLQSGFFMDEIIFS